ncbi:MAG: Ig-like domain-containing protein [Clostridia bacterium]
MNRIWKWFLCLAVIFSLMPGSMMYAAEPDPVPPVARDMAISTKENTPILKVQADAEGDGSNALLYYVVEEPKHGMLDFLEHGVFSYEPNEGFTGTDTFRYKAKQGQIESNIATVTITVEPQAGGNRAPKANDLQVNTIEETTVNGQLTATDEDGDSLSFSMDSQPKKGELSFDTQTGAFRYTPRSGEVGSDSFTYHVFDGNVNSNVATVTIVIEEKLNHPPVASNLAVTTMERMPVKMLIEATDEDGDALSYEVVDQPQKGELQFFSSGLFLYVPGDGMTGKDEFTYIARDRKGQSNLAKVEITVQKLDNGNHAPFAFDVGVLAVNMMPVTGFLKGTDPDRDALRYELVDAPGFGSVQLNSESGEFTYAAGPWAEGADSFTYRVTDGKLYSDYAQVLITIQKVQNTPPHANDMSITTKVGKPVSGKVTATDKENDVLSFGIVDQGTKGLVTLDAGTGSFTYTPEQGKTGKDTFVFIVNDRYNYSNQGTVTIQIDEDTEIPQVVVSNLTLQTKPSKSVQARLTASAPQGSAISYQLVSEPTKQATVSIVGDMFTYTPKAGTTGTDVLRYQATVGENQSNIGTITIKIGNPPPAYYPVTAVELDKTRITMKKDGGSVSLQAKVSPSYATNQAVTWKSSAPQIASVDQNGRVTARAKGEAVITVTTVDGNLTATCVVIVIADPEVVRLEAVDKGLLLKPDQSFVPKVYAVYDDGERVNITNDRQNITYQSSNTSIVSVKGALLRTGSKEGEAVLTIRYAGVETDVVVIVTKSKLKSLKPSVKKLELGVGEVETVSLNVYLSNGKTIDVTKLATWKSSNPQVATVEGGMVTAREKGVVSLTASFGGRKVVVRVIIP